MKFARESKYANGVCISGIVSDNAALDGTEWKRYQSYKQLVQDSDALYVASHPSRHYKYVKMALEAGKHVIYESPLALAVEEAEELFALAEKNNCILYASIKTAYSIAYARMILMAKTGKIGDIVSVDLGTICKEYYSDAARTFAVGTISDEAARLIRVTEESFFEGLKFCRPGYRLSDVSHAIQSHAESAGFSVVRDFVGHGIGRNMHEDPQVPNYGRPGRGPRLVPGMVLAIEPMINAGDYDVEVMSNNWTVETIDGSLSAHYENTVVITEGEPLLLTL